MDIYKSTSSTKSFPPSWVDFSEERRTYLIEVFKFENKNIIGALCERVKKEHGEYNSITRFVEYRPDMFAVRAHRIELCYRLIYADNQTVLRLIHDFFPSLKQGYDNDCLCNFSNLLQAELQFRGLNGFKKKITPISASPILVDEVAGKINTAIIQTSETIPIVTASISFVSTEESGKGEVDGIIDEGRDPIQENLVYFFKIHPKFREIFTTRGKGYNWQRSYNELVVKIHHGDTAMTGFTPPEIFLPISPEALAHVLGVLVSREAILEKFEELSGIGVKTETDSEFVRTSALLEHPTVSRNDLLFIIQNSDYAKNIIQSPGSGKNSGLANKWKRFASNWNDGSYRLGEQHISDRSIPEDIETIAIILGLSGAKAKDFRGFLGLEKTIPKITDSIHSFPNHTQLDRLFEEELREKMIGWFFHKDGFEGGFIDYRDYFNNKKASKYGYIFFTSIQELFEGLGWDNIKQKGFFISAEVLVSVLSIEESGMRKGKERGEKIVLGEKGINKRLLRREKRKEELLDWYHNKEGRDIFKECLEKGFVQAWKKLAPELTKQLSISFPNDLTSWAGILSGIKKRANIPSIIEDLGDLHPEEILQFVKKKGGVQVRQKKISNLLGDPERKEVKIKKSSQEGYVHPKTIERQERVVVLMDWYYNKKGRDVFKECVEKGFTKAWKERVIKLKEEFGINFPTSAMSWTQTFSGKIQDTSIGNILKLLGDIYPEEILSLSKRGRKSKGGNNMNHSDTLAQKKQTIVQENSDKGELGDTGSILDDTLSLDGASDDEDVRLSELENPVRKKRSTLEKKSGWNAKIDTEEYRRVPLSRNIEKVVSSALKTVIERTIRSGIQNRVQKLIQHSEAWNREHPDDLVPGSIDEWVHRTGVLDRCIIEVRGFMRQIANPNVVNFQSQFSQNCLTYLFPALTKREGKEKFTLLNTFRFGKDIAVEYPLTIEKLYRYAGNGGDQIFMHIFQTIAPQMRCPETTVREVKKRTRRILPGHTPTETTNAVGEYSFMNQVRECIRPFLNGYDVYIKQHISGIFRTLVEETIIPYHLQGQLLKTRIMKRRDQIILIFPEDIVQLLSNYQNRLSDIINPSDELIDRIMYLVEIAGVTITMSEVMSLFQEDNGANPYDLLGISRETNEKEARNIYRKLMFQYHPDRQTSSENSSKNGAKITEAWRLICKEQGWEERGS